MSRNPSWFTFIKHAAFQSLQRLTERRQTAAKPARGLNRHLECSSADSKRCFWIYASTIGELNAVDPLVRRLSQSMDYDYLVILSDHPHYLEAFRKSFPNALIVFLQEGERAILDYLAVTMPSLLLIAEIPCMLFDAPCRLPFTIFFHAKKLRCHIVVANGWLYDEQPACRMDHLETWLFHREYIRAIDLFLMQREEDAEVLRQRGAIPQTLRVTGNLKFDQLQKAIQEYVANPDKVILQILKSPGSRPVIVAGCVTNISEQELVLDALLQILMQLPETLLILAPRHPENTARMEQLRKMLEQRELSYQFRSADGNVISEAKNVLILDTIGELKYCYSIGDVCYVGLNHNVLEPLVFGRPVVVTSGWNPKFPSYPVYFQLKSKAVIHEVASTVAVDLSRSLLHYLQSYGNSGCENGETPAAQIPENLSGALQRDYELISGLLNKQPCNVSAS